MRNKTPNMQLLFPLCLMGALGLLLTVGCVSSGSLSLAALKISDCEKALSAARQSPAGAHTAVELRSAEDKLAQAKRALAGDEYLQATRLAEQATADADCARIEAEAEKAKKDSDQMRQNFRSRIRYSESISR